MLLEHIPYIRISYIHIIPPFPFVLVLFVSI